jgi:hypothetical protein
MDLIIFSDKKHKIIFFYLRMQSLSFYCIYIWQKKVRETKEI